MSGIAREKSPTENQPLLNNRNRVDLVAAEKLKRSFLIMCVSMAANMGVVTTVIAYAGKDFPAVGLKGTGVLYGAYCFSALFLAPLILAVFGNKKCLVGGLTQYCVYLMAYLVAELIGTGKTCSPTDTTCVPVDTPSASIAVVLVGSFIGGLGSGYLWPAQGAYFAASSKKYAELAGITEEAATGQFSTYFATCFLVFEISFKFIGGGIKQAAGEVGTKAMYAVFFGVGVCAVFGMTQITSIEPPSTGEKKTITMALATQKAGAAMRLLCSNPKMALMLPFEFAFGLSAAFLNGYVSSQVTKNVFKWDKSGSLIGYFSGIVAVVACVVSIAGGRFIAAFKLKSPLMLIGCLGFLGMAVPFIFFDNPGGWSSDDASSYVKLAALYSSQGVGRGVFESTNKAVIADFFPSDAPAAFANVIWSSGGSSAVGYFIFGDQIKSLEGDSQAIIVSGFAFAGLFCYIVAASIHNKKPSENVDFSADDDK